MRRVDDWLVLSFLVVLGFFLVHLLGKRAMNKAPAGSKNASRLPDTLYPSTDMKCSRCSADSNCLFSKGKHWIVFGRESCPYCVGTKRFLKEKGQCFVFRPPTNELWEAFPEEHTVPQIFQPMGTHVTNGFTGLKRAWANIYPSSTPREPPVLER